MKARKFFFISLAFAVITLALELTAFSQRRHSGRVISRPLHLSENELAIAKQEAKTYSDRAMTISLLGLASAIFSLVLVIQSWRKHEPGWRSLVFALLIFYLLLQFAIT